MKTNIFSKKNLFSELFGITLVLIMVIILFSILSENFFTIKNIFLIIRNITTYGLMALGGALVIITGGIDLSVGSTFAISGVVTALGITKYNLGIIPSICLGIFTGILIGTLNGGLVIKVGLTPFVATFAMLSVVRGLGFAITGGFTVPIYTEAFTKIGMGYVGPIPIPVIIFLFFILIFYFLLNRITFGRILYATGSNSTATFFSGINTKKIKFMTYVISGAMCAIAGIISSAKVGLGSSTSGQGFELDVITAIVLGGVSLQGGKGNIVGVIIGATIMGVLRNGLLLLNISAYYQTIIIGLIIITVTSLDAVRSRKMYAI